MLGRVKVRGTLISMLLRPNKPITGSINLNRVSSSDPLGNTRDLLGNSRVLLCLERFFSKPWDMLDKGEEICCGTSGLQLSHIFSIEVNNIMRYIWVPFIRGAIKTYCPKNPLLSKI